jgi:Putative adhesin
MRMTRLNGILGRQSATIFVSLLVAGAFYSTAHAGEYSKSFTVSNRATVHINTNDGDVRVTAGDAKQVEIHVNYRGYEEGKTLHFESQQTGGGVEFTARAKTVWPLSIGIHELHIEVRLPKDGDLKVETGDGEIHASGLSGNIDLRSGDGELSVSALSGVLRLHTGDGGIDGRDLDGQCDASSGDGAIKLAGRFDVLKVKSGDGEIEVKAAHGSVMKSSWSVESGDGGIEVALPGDLAASIDASTGDGHISTDMPITVSGKMNKSRVQGTLNGGGQSVTIRTGDGNVRLGQS